MKSQRPIVGFWNLWDLLAKQGLKRKEKHRAVHNRIYFGFSHLWKFLFNFLFIAKRIQKWITCLIIRNKWDLVNYSRLKLSVQNLEPHPIPYPSTVLQPHITGIWAIINLGKYQREDFYETAKDFLMNFVASFKSRLEDENEASL